MPEKNKSSADNIINPPVDSAKPKALQHIEQEYGLRGSFIHLYLPHQKQGVISENNFLILFELRCRQISLLNPEFYQLLHYQNKQGKTFFNHLFGDELNNDYSSRLSVFDADNYGEILIHTPFSQFTAVVNDLLIKIFPDAEIKIINH